MKNILLILMLIVPVIANGQASISWIQNTNGVSLAVDNSNNVFTINNQTFPGGDIYLTKRNSGGTQLWQAHYDNTDSTKFEKAVYVETDNGGNAIVIGTISGLAATTGGNGGIVMKFDPSGNLLWRNVFENTSPGTYTKKCIIDASNNIYILYGSMGNTLGNSLKVRKYSPEGAMIWNYTGTSSTSVQIPVNFKFTGDNFIVVSGRSAASNSNGYLRLDLNGNLIWNITGIASMTQGDAAGDNSGNTYLVNSATSSVTGGTSVRKVNSNGTQIGQSNYPLSAQRVEVGSDNMPVIVGMAGSNTIGTAFAKLNPEGVLQWINLNATGNLIFMSHAMIKMDNSNSTYLAGSTSTAMAVCKVNSGGLTSWVIAVPGFGTVSNFMGGMDIGSDNAVYVTGSLTAKIVQSNLPAPCPIPQNLFTNDITLNSARVNWDLVAGAVRYDILYRPAISITPIRGWEKRSVPGNVNNLVLTSLRCNTLYNWRIRAVCDSLSPIATPNLSEIQSFRTAACNLDKNIE